MNRAPASRDFSFLAAAKLSLLLAPFFLEKVCVLSIFLPLLPLISQTVRGSVMSSISRACTFPVNRTSIENEDCKSNNIHSMESMCSVVCWVVESLSADGECLCPVLLWLSTVHREWRGKDDECAKCIVQCCSERKPMCKCSRKVWQLLLYESVHLFVIAPLTLAEKVDDMK